MKKTYTVLLCLLLYEPLAAQRDMASFNTQQQLEDLSEKGDTAPEDDLFLQKLHYFSRHPVNLNKAGKEELQELGLFNEIHIDQLLTYRRLLGRLLSLYELQAVPGWDLPLIQQVLPYVTLTDAATGWNKIKTGWNGESGLLLRYSSQPEKAAGYVTDTSGKRPYLGSPVKLYLRYQYKTKEGLQLSLVGEKDAGEQFLRGNRKAGFDFYSFHVATGKIGIIKQFIVGDYTVSMGQGLIQWQGLSVGTGAGLIAAERQASVLRPYSSPGELAFYRGAAISLQKRKWELTGFFSFRRLSAHTDLDTGGRQEVMTSLLSSGYHRTAGELRTKNNIRRVSGGGAISYTNSSLRLALQAVHHLFSTPFQKGDQPYNLFALRGRSFFNGSASYSYTHRNLHVFGEAAADSHFHKAGINGLLVSLHPRVDLAVVHRSISREYQSVEANAITQNAQPVNESGLYTGITVRPSDVFTIQAALDRYRFPWVRYRIDAPSNGKEGSVQISYKPTKQTELISRFRWQSKPRSVTGADGTMSRVEAVQQINWRLHLNVSASKSVTVQNRCEVVWYNKMAPDAEQGFLFYSEVYYHAGGLPVSGSARVQYVETDGYNSRLYAFENSVRYGFSIPAFFDKGFRYYGNLHVNVSSLFHTKSPLHIDGWVRWAQSVYPGRNGLGDGNDRIAGNKKSELTLQVILNK